MVYYTISYTGTNSRVSHFLISLFIPLTAAAEHSLKSEIILGSMQLSSLRLSNIPILFIFLNVILFVPKHPNHFKETSRNSWRNTCPNQGCYSDSFRYRHGMARSACWLVSDVCSATMRLPWVTTAYFNLIPPTSNPDVYISHNEMENYVCYATSG